MSTNKIPLPTTMLAGSDYGIVFQGKMNGMFDAVRAAITAYNNQIDALQTVSTVLQPYENAAQRLAQVEIRIEQIPDEVDAAGTASALLSSHNQNAAAHPELSAFVSAEADRAELAASVAAASGSIFDTVSAGEAVALDGGYFWVVSPTDDDVLMLFKMGQVAATDTGKRLVSATFVQNLKMQLEKNIPDRSLDLNNNMLFALTDKSGRRTWLEAQSSDGKPTDYATKVIYDVVSEQLPADIVDLDLPGVLFALTDKSGRRTWLEAQSSDGKPTDYATKVIYDVVSEQLPADIVDLDLPGVLFALTDKSGRRTWLEAQSSDGKPTNYAAKVIYDVVSEQLPADFVDLAFPGVLAAVTDKSGRLTDLTVREEDGQIPDWVMLRWADRLKDILEIEPVAKIPLFFYKNNYPASAPPLLANDVYNRDGETLPVFPNMNRIVVLGSSSAQGLNQSLGAWCSARSIHYTGMGSGSEWSVQNAARIGAIPFLLTFPNNVIPAEGQVFVTASNYQVSPNSFGSLLPFNGTIGGVRGQLRVPAGESSLRFSRFTAGETVAIAPDEPFIPDLGDVVRNDVYVFWLAKNDLNHNPPDTLTNVIRRLNTIFNWMGPMFPRGLVLGNFFNGNHSPGTPARDRIDAVNDYQRTRFGDRFIDIQAWIESEQLWVDTGIAPTADDLIAQQERRLPPSVRLDNGHFNSATMQVITNKLINDKFNDLGWY